MKPQILALIILLLSVACSKKNSLTPEEAVVKYKPTHLFTYDGCKFYRFSHRPGEYLHFVKCDGHNSSTIGK